MTSKKYQNNLNIKGLVMNLFIQQTIMLIVGIISMVAYMFTENQYFGIVGNIWIVGSIIVGTMYLKD